MGADVHIKMRVEYILKDDSLSVLVFIFPMRNIQDSLRKLLKMENALIKDQHAQMKEFISWNATLFLLK